MCPNQTWDSTFNVGRSRPGSPKRDRARHAGLTRSHHSQIEFDLWEPGQPTFYQGAGAARAGPRVTASDSLLATRLSMAA
jgi:hypothetical protein